MINKYNYIIDGLVNKIANGCTEKDFLAAKIVVKKILKVSHRRLNYLIDERIDQTCLFIDGNNAAAVGKKYWELFPYIYHTSASSYDEYRWFVANR